MAARSVLLVVLLTAGCITGESSSPNRVPADSTATTDPAASAPLSLVAEPSAEWFVADGYRFGSVPPSRAQLAVTFAAQPEVSSADHRVAIDAATGAAGPDVFVLAVDGSTFTDITQVDDWLAAVVEARAGEAPDATALGRWPAWLATGAAALRSAGTAVVVDGPGAAGVLRSIADARAAGRTGTGVAATPLAPLRPDDVFVDLPAATLVAPGDTPDVERPGLPSVGWASGFPAARLIGIGGELRGVAYAVAVDLTIVPTAEELATELDALAGALGEPTAPLVTDDVVVRRVTGTDGPVRLFHRGSVVVVAFGDDDVALDALVADWVSALVSA